MNKFLKSVLVIFLISAATEIHAQFKSGYVFGMNLSTMTLKLEGKYYDAETPIGFHFGGFYEIPVSRNFALQPAFLFSAKGTDYKIDTLSVSLSPVYIEVPVNVSYSFGSHVVKVTLFSGTYFACAIGGYKIESGSEIQDISYGSGDNHDLRPLDIGLNLGARIMFRGLQVSVQYGLGLANISPYRTFDSEIKNRVIGISIRRTR